MTQHRKICSLPSLLSAREAARGAGRTVVHCHGCFDIVHPGHIHHLQYARSLGDLLIVSISADSHVSKGVARPLIPGDLRAASVAALECVDLVYINPDPTAAELLEALQPDVYVKGREYENSVDARFLRERDTVMRHGGRVIFSSGDIVYSSTALIGSLPTTQQFNDEKIHRFCSRHDLTARHLQQLVHRFRGQRVVVIGDYLLDRYHFCDADGIAGESPMMALRALERRDFDGGAAIVSQHLARFGAAPTLITTLADDERSSQVEMRLRAAGIEVRAMRQRRPLVTKHRFLVEENKLFKVDDGPITPLDSHSEQLLARQVFEASAGAAAVILCDFGYGLITAGLLERILPRLRQSVPIITADVSGKQTNLLRFRNVDLLCPSEREMREMLHDFSSGLGAVVSSLLRSTSARQAIITLGKQGLVTCDWPMQTPEASVGRLRSEYLPAMTSHVVDALGAGDALLAAASLTLACGGSLHSATLLGSFAAAIEVQQLGNVPIGADELLAAITAREAAVNVKRLAS